MHALWKDYFELLMEFEGEVFENDPHDPGGATKYGVDQRSHPEVNIAALTKRTAEAIFLSEYEESAASKFPAPFSFCYFDFAVNAGEGSAARALQRAVGVVSDGVVGKVTVGATMHLIRAEGVGRLIKAFSAHRKFYYNNLASKRGGFERFLDGWLNRTVAMQRWAEGRI